jgi:uncharacterized damage-inducible protein DinB
MDLAAHFRMLAGYNRMANQRLYAHCARLDEAEFRQERPGPFGSIRGLLNHLLLGDGIWMARFEGGGTATPALDTVLHDDYAGLARARTAMTNASLPSSTPREPSCSRAVWPTRRHRSLRRRWTCTGS